MADHQTININNIQNNQNENDNLQESASGQLREIKKFHSINKEHNINREEKYQKKKSQKFQIPNPIELTWKHLTIDAFVKKKVKNEKGKKKKVTERRQILKDLNGTLKPGQFTAIMGPSGCGKTTLLNFLSGRLAANNMEISGNLLLNNNEIKDMDDYSNQIAYVLQDDILLATFTPQEAFKFTADLRLKTLNDAQKKERVDNLINELGLTKCKDTKIGNAMIRGVSGGERKRTSIGVELLTNPSMIFLDEPTTGLDSNTALQVVELLKSISQKGVNVVSTIHQPSSEIFNSFQRLILICRGSIIYQGDSNRAVDYFSNIGHRCPDFSNPADYFMKLMNQEGLIIEIMQSGQQQISELEVSQQFEKRIEHFVAQYKDYEMTQQLEPTFKNPLSKNDNSFNVNKIKQFFLLLKRSFISQIRDPMDVLMKSVQMIIFAVATVIVFDPLGENQPGIQNRAGALFFLAAMNSFSSIQGSIATFSAERPLFLRERLNKSYGVGPYFWGKNLAEFPFQLLYPLISVVITYFIIGLNDLKGQYFFILCLTMILTSFYGTSYGLLISVMIPKMEVAMSLVPVLVIPFMVLGGFFINTNNVPGYFKWIEYLSMFKYGFQAAVLNEFDTINFDCKDPQGQACDPIGQFGIKETIGESLLALVILGIGCRLIAYIMMHFISTPKRPKLNEKKSQKSKKCTKIKS